MDGHSDTLYGYVALLNTLLGGEENPLERDELRRRAAEVLKAWEDRYLAAPARREPAPQPPSESIPSGLTRDDFVLTLAAAGQHGELALAKHGLVNLDQMNAGERMMAMAKLKAELLENGERFVRTNPAPTAPRRFDVGLCPNSVNNGVRKSHGDASPPHQDDVEGIEREGDPGEAGYWVCPDRECFRVNGSHTSWNARNYAARIDEFVTGQVAAPRPRTGGYGRGRR